MARFFLVFVTLLLSSAVEGVPLRDTGATVLTPGQAEDFFRKAGKEVDCEGTEVSLSVDGLSVRIASIGGEIFLTFNGKTLSVNNTLDPLLPVDDALALVPFDFLCPFFRWEEVRYEGPGTALGRAVQRFTAVSPGGWIVRVWLDAKYFYPLCWDLYNPFGELCRSFRLRSIKKNAGGEWGMGRAQVCIPGESRTIIVVPGQCRAEK